MKRKAKLVATKLNKKKVEDGILVLVKGATPSTDLDFSEIHLLFKDRNLFERNARAFRDFQANGVSFKQASKDERKMIITYLFH